jgi:hypothetical protein
MFLTALLGSKKKRQCFCFIILRFYYIINIISPVFYGNLWLGRQSLGQIHEVNSTGEHCIDVTPETHLNTEPELEFLNF